MRKIAILATASIALLAGLPISADAERRHTPRDFQGLATPARCTAARRACDNACRMEAIVYRSCFWRCRAAEDKCVRDVFNKDVVPMAPVPGALGRGSIVPPQRNLPDIKRKF